MALATAMPGCTRARFPVARAVSTASPSVCCRSIGIWRTRSSRDWCAGVREVAFQSFSRDPQGSAGGIARPIAHVVFDNGSFRFTVPPQWESRKTDVTFTGLLKGGTLRGETTDDKGARLTWSGRRAPALKRPHPPQWGDAIDLFNGKD